jgi:hypothetical protein
MGAAWPEGGLPDSPQGIAAFGAVQYGGEGRTRNSIEYQLVRLRSRLLDTISREN